MHHPHAFDGYPPSCAWRVSPLVLLTVVPPHAFDGCPPSCAWRVSLMRLRGVPPHALDGCPASCVWRVSPLMRLTGVPPHALDGCPPSFAWRVSPLMNRDPVAVWGQGTRAFPRQGKKTSTSSDHTASPATSRPDAKPCSCFLLCCCAGTVAGFAAGSWIYIYIYIDIYLYICIWIFIYIYMYIYLCKEHK